MRLAEDRLLVPLAVPGRCSAAAEAVAVREHELPFPSWLTAVRSLTSPPLHSFAMLPELVQVAPQKSRVVSCQAAIAYADHVTPQSFPRSIQLTGFPCDARPRPLSRGVWRGLADYSPPASRGARPEDDSRNAFRGLRNRRDITRRVSGRQAHPPPATPVTEPDIVGRNTRYTGGKGPQ